MNFRQFYETVILRDLLEYTVPGFISSLSIFMVFEALFIYVPWNISIVDWVIEYTTFTIIIAVFISYLAGHALTALSRKCLRFPVESDSRFKKMLRLIYSLSPDPPKDNEKESLFGENHWLHDKITELVKSELDMDEEKVNKKFKKLDPNGLKKLRPVIRGLIRVRQPELYSEFVARHSILSRFIENLMISIWMIFFSTLASTFITWKQISKIPGPEQQTSWCIAAPIAVFCLLLLVLIFILRGRSENLRNTMSKHTYQIWYTDSVIQRQLAHSNSDNE